jgi:hypothetical protein
LTIAAWFKRLFVQSSVIHLHQDPAPTLGELVDLMDRFLDGHPRYPLEWDDFISWEHANPNVEAARNAIGRHERLLFSGTRRNREVYCGHVIEERNRLAAVLGQPRRDNPFSSMITEGGLFTSRDLAS